MGIQKTYFLVNSTDYAPGPQSLIRLGQVISNLREPFRALAAPHEPFPSVHSAWKSDYTFNQENGVSGSIGLGAAFLAQLGSPITGGTSGTLIYKNITRWKVKRLETEFIEPDAEYVRNSVLGVPTVKEYLEQHKRLGFPKAVYMVTGIKIARGASLLRTNEHTYGGEGDINVDLSMLSGVPVTPGINAKVEREIEEKESFGDNSDFIFAYRLQKIYVSWRFKDVQAKQVTGGELVGLDSDAESDYTEGEDGEEAEIEDVLLEDRDFGSSFDPLQFKSLSVEDEENGDSCRALYPEVA
jgi:hypothetical protein